MNEIPKCAHVHDDGQPCQAIPVKGTPYCYFHRKYYNPPALPGDKNYVAPLLESHHAIELALTHLYQAFVAKKIDRKEASFGLQLLRLASKTISAIEKQKREERMEKKEWAANENPQTARTEVAAGLAGRSSATERVADPQERACANRALDLAQQARSAVSVPNRGTWDPYGCMPKPEIITRK